MENSELKIPYEKLLPAILEVLVDIKSELGAMNALSNARHGDLSNDFSSANKTFEILQEIYRRSYDDLHGVMLEYLNQTYGS